MEKYCITLDQAKRLTKIGVLEKFSSFLSQYCWLYFTNESKIVSRDSEEFFDVESYSELMWHYPAYNVGELGEMLPSRAVSCKCSDRHEPGVFKAYSQRQSETPVMYGETEAQARGELLIYLLENGLV